MDTQIITVESYFKIGDEFLNVYQYAGPFVEEHIYINGAIILKIGTKKILGLKHWDYVILFWILFVAALKENSLNQGNNYSFSRLTF